MADSETQQPVDTSQQVTSKTPTIKQKDPKKVAAGKALQKKNREEAKRSARKFFQDQKKALDEANMKIAEYELEKSETRVTDTPAESTKNVLTTTQWLSAISIFVSLAGIYCKHEEIKSLLTKKSTVNTLPRALPPSPVDTVPLLYGLKK